MEYRVFFLCILVANVSVLGQGSNWVNERSRQAVEQGLKYLVKHQNLAKGDYYGSFGDYRGDNKYSIAVTSFACLALIADGNLPERGRYGANVAAGLRFILRCAKANKSGYITWQGDHSRMHGHGFAALMLAQVYGTSTDSKLTAEIREYLERAVICSINAQTADGGWGYYPDDPNHEGSITVCQLQALRACRNVGISVPKETIDKAIGYLKMSANPDGSFKYRLGNAAGRKSFPLTAAGVSSLNATGEYELEEIRKGLKFMMDYMPPDGIKDKIYNNWFYYGQFYAVQAMFHAPSGYWEKWYPAIRDDLLAKQRRPGEWGRYGTSGQSYYGIVYATAIATLILQVPYNYLPIFQR